MPTACRICSFDNHVEGAEFCQKCGATTENFCPNDSCYLNNGPSSPTPYDADYCPYCGTVTTLSDVEE